MAKINYGDKTGSQIPGDDSTKWKAEDANQVKQIVNDHDDSIIQNAEGVAANANAITAVDSKANSNTNSIDTTKQEVETNTALITQTQAALDLITYGVNVRSFGAAGDGKADDTLPIQNAIENARENNLPVYFPAGYYKITDTLPFYTGMRWFGDQMPDQQYFETEIASITDIGNGVMEIITPAPAGEKLLLNRPADLIRVDNTGESDNSGTFELVEAIDNNDGLKVLRYKNSSGVNESAPDGATVVTTPTGGGSNIILFSLEDGSPINNVQFIDCDNVRAAVIEDMGFLGQGIDQVYGGGIRFRRIKTAGGRSRAVSGYSFKRIFMNNIPQDALRIEQPINSVFEMVIIKKAVGDGIKFKAGSAAGVNTSTKIDTCYIQNCRCAIYIDTMAYNVITNTVIEGSKIGVFVTQGRGTTINSLASETIKYGNSGHGNGIMFLSVSSYGNVINGLTDYYNTEKGQGQRGMMQFIDPSRRIDTPASVVNGGYVHNSIGDSGRIVGTYWSGTNGRIYVDVSGTNEYVPASENGGSSWNQDGYLAADRQIFISNVTQGDIFNDNRFFVSKSPTRNSFSGSNSFKSDRNPNQYDDVTKGHAAFGNSTQAQWQNELDPNRETSRWFCIDDTPNNAVWIQNEHLYLIDFYGRVNRNNSKESEYKYVIGSEAKFSKVGRNYSFDIATSLGSRVLETEVVSGVPKYRLDVFDRIPKNFLVTIRDEDDSYVTESFVRGCYFETLNGINYVRVDIIDNSIPITTPSDAYIPYLGSSVTTKELGYSEQFYCSYVKNFGSGDLSFLIEADQFVPIGSSMGIYNCMLKEFNTKGSSVTNSVVAISTENNDAVCIEVTIDQPKSFKLTNNTQKSLDTGYAIGTFMGSHDLSSSLQVNLPNGAIYLDPTGAMTMGKAREGRLKGTLENYRLNLPGTNQYDFDIKAPLRQLDFVTVTRQDDYGIEFTIPADNVDDLVWTATPRKEIGFNRIRDRQSDAITMESIFNRTPYTDPTAEREPYHSVIFAAPNSVPSATDTMKDFFGFDAFFTQGKMFVDYNSSVRFQEILQPSVRYYSSDQQGLIPLRMALMNNRDKWDHDDVVNNTAYQMNQLRVDLLEEGTPSVVTDFLLGMKWQITTTGTVPEDLIFSSLLVSDATKDPDATIEFDWTNMTISYATSTYSLFIEQLPYTADFSSRIGNGWYQTKSNYPASSSFFLEPAPIYLDSNGITVRADRNTAAGHKETINGNEYTVVDIGGLTEAIANGDDLSYLVTSNIIDMSLLFFEADVVGSIAHFDTSRVRNMSDMFSGSSFDGDISAWDVSNVYRFDRFAKDTTNLNQDLTVWPVNQYATYTDFAEGSTSFKDYHHPLAMKNPFYLAENGVTVIAKPEVVVGQKGSINGKEYQLVDRESLELLIADIETDLSGLCTTGITSMSSLIFPAYYGSYSYDPNDPYGGMPASFVTIMLYQETQPDMFQAFYGLLYMFIGEASPDEANADIIIAGLVDPMFLAAAAQANIDQELIDAFSSLASTFLSAQLEVVEGIDGWDVSSVTDFSFFAEGYYGTIKGDLNNWDMSSCTNIEFMFDETDLDIDISNWDTSNIQNMQYALSYTNKDNIDAVLDISNWNTSSVTDMSGLLQSSEFEPDLNSWDTSNVTDMSNMFSLHRTYNKPLDNFDTSKVNNFSHMFDGAYLFNQDITGWNTSEVSNFDYMFSNTKKFNQPIGVWDTSKATSMRMTFNATEANGNTLTDFNQDLSGWDVSNVVSMRGIFQGTQNTSNINIGGWDVSSVVDFTYMFEDSTFNGDISSWNVSSAEQMYMTFGSTTAFNVDISSWDVSSVDSIRNLFSGATAFNQDLTSWADKLPGNVDTAGYANNATAWEEPNKIFAVPSQPMFELAANGVTVVALPGTQVGDSEELNGVVYTLVDTDLMRTKLGEGEDGSGFCTSEVTNLDDLSTYNYYDLIVAAHWDTSKVTSMNLTFMYTCPEDDLSNWDTSNVTDMQSCFEYGDIPTGIINWDVSSVENFEGIFWGTSYYGENNSNAPGPDYDHSLAPDLSGWNVSSGKNFSYMFHYSGFLDPNISGWDLSSATNLNYMFEQCNFNGDLSGWTLPTAQNYTMKSMFSGVGFNQDISMWDVSMCTDFSKFLDGNGEFNQNLSCWAADVNADFTDYDFEATSWEEPNKILSPCVIPG